MNTTDNKPAEDKQVDFLIPTHVQRTRQLPPAKLALPRALASTTRAPTTTRNLFLNETALVVEQVFDLSQGARAADSSTPVRFVNEKLMVLEAQDGSVVIMRADKLHAELQRLYPERVKANEPLDLSVLKDSSTQTRGLGSWIWSKLSVLNLSSDSFISAAQEQALEWLDAKLGKRYQDLAYAQASWFGAKALMSAIESKIEGEPGLYRWTAKQIQLTDRISVEDQALTNAVKNNEPLLIFIHGTGSNTLGSFGDLRSENQEITWDALTRAFNKQVYGFEHRTLSESPLENALQLAKALPKGARFSLVTHSRGGLVGDLLCLNDFDPNLIKHYQRRPTETDGKLETEEQRKIRELVVAEEQQQLTVLRTLLLEKQFKIERYIRVACPAGGTTLMADNIDLCLSGLLSLLSLGAGLIPAIGAVSASVLNAFRRVVLEIAAKRIDPRFIPGLEAMLPDSPLTGLLATASRSDKIQMLAITGTTDTNEASILKRIAIIFTDWVLFDRIDNDFVVDTQSMRAGLAKRNSSYEFYTKGQQVSHLHYFQRSDTRRALYQWLTMPEPTQLAGFTRIPTDCDLKLDSKKLLEPTLNRGTASVSSRPANAPIVFYLPGMMGAHLSIRPKGQNTGDRIWFDPFDLAAGGIYSLKMEMPNIIPDGLFEHYYGGLQQYLEKTYEVIPFAYDWRLSLSSLAKQFGELLKAKLQALGSHHHQRPVSILAHGMGGLIVRMLMANPKLSELWEQIATRPNSHLIMLGTPNQGSYAAVESLLGKGQGVRYLASLDFHHNLQEVLEVIAEFDGLLQLLPAEANPAQSLDYFDNKTWEQLQALNRDRWFGSGQGFGAVPTKARLAAAKKAWETLKQQEANSIPHAHRIAYVFGVDTHTPVNLKLEDQRLVLEGTTEGDGTVTWEAGRLQGLSEGQYWYMPVSHCNLTNTPQYFAALAELLQTGTSNQLAHTPPRQRSTIHRSYRYEAGPVLHAGAEEVALAFFGGRPQREVIEDKTQTLQVAVRAMDLRFVQQPIICGHYQADSIASAERMIDKYLVGGALSQRERLGIYAGPVSTSTIILRPRNHEDLRRHTCRGAIIVGLGEWNLITAQKITDTVRDGVLNYLLTLPLNPSLETDQIEPLGLNSLLIGYNSTTHITVEASIEAIVRGVCEANQQYRYNCEDQPKRAITKLDFVEFYLDTAITAAYIVRDLPKRLETDLQRLEARLEPASELITPHFQGMRHRLSERTIGGGYWPRLMVTNAQEASEREDNKPAELLKYVYLSERARAETLIQQRQPGLVEALIRDAIRSSEYKQDISRTLFQLMIPFDFKSAARQTSRLLLILDSYTANLPWEMLQADEEPLALQVQMVRQLSSMRFRRRVTTTISKTACVIANPLTSNFYRQFPSYDPEPQNQDSDKSLSNLAGATREGLQVAELLERNNYTVERCLPATPEDAPSQTALDVFNTLFKKPYRILMIAAHGEVDLTGMDGKNRTGVILSDGTLLTAAEVSQMEEIPDLVFLNCCHLAVISSTNPQSAKSKKEPSYNHLAYSISRELIEMGVRCVIAAGWAVDDAAACSFSTAFFEHFIEKNQSFGQAVYEARRQTRLLYPELNTWGAYQAYGDPSFMLDPPLTNKSTTPCQQQVSAHELQDYLTSIDVDMHQKVREYSFDSLHAELEQVAANLSNPAWLKTPGTQYQLARLYGHILPEGFDEARKACQAAIAAEDRNGQVPIIALEQLANLESRQAEVLALKALELKTEDSERPELFKEAQALASTAIQRLEGLLLITQYVQVAAAVEGAMHLNSNAERQALLGSAYKRLAIILLQENPTAWPAIKETLTKSMDAYKQGEAKVLGAGLKAYPLINRLQLAAILNTLPEDEDCFELLDQAHNTVRLQFADSHEFFDAVMSADIEVARFLADRRTQMSELKPAAYFIQLYQDAIQDLAVTPRIFNSVVQQLRNLAQLLCLAVQNLYAGQPELAALCEQKVKVLVSIAADLDKP